MATSLVENDAEVSVFGKLASENGSEAPFFIVLAIVAFIG